MNPRALAREILLYDRLVLPTPEDETEADRWDHQGWDTYRLAYIADHLGDDLVHPVPWNSHMRHLWHDHMRLLAGAGQTSEGAAYGATPMIMVGFVWTDVYTHLSSEDCLHSLHGSPPPISPRTRPRPTSTSPPPPPTPKPSPNAKQASCSRAHSRSPTGDDDEDVFLRHCASHASLTSSRCVAISMTTKTGSSAIQRAGHSEGRGERRCRRDDWRLPGALRQQAVHDAVRL